METTLPIPISSPSPSPLQPPPPPTNLRNPHRRRRNVPRSVKFPMPVIDLALRRSSAKVLFQLRFKIPQFPINNQIRALIPPNKMADPEPNNTEAQMTATAAAAAANVGLRRVEEKKESEKPAATPVPPPPEKPLPGDCCGSGCVRCVWDVYYEELEEYNKLYKAN
ncbi:hypothetical protein STAS_17057 [Striga asiatica]|uniref:Oxidoreductase-like domain-containing protein n=1 Tax=Striga asiatica TaxID=4170 RepID=A0A5A7Q585_STRAF|nr:hypothetical protein STAS_17057 [Striga asiatica]